MPAKPRIRPAANAVAQLYTQASRAREMAAECGSPLVAGLFKVHARICEENAKVRQRRKGKGKNPA